MIRLIRTAGAAFWKRSGERRALAVFRDASRRVPAYRDFLKKHRINADKIKSRADLESVPSTDKQNYLRQYPLEKLCWDGTLKRPLVFTATSGSTGEPFYFPRSESLEWEYSTLLQLFLENGWRDGRRGPTLVIIGFGMGVWIGGLLTYRAFEMAAARMAYPVSIVTPGINKPEILNVLRRLAPHFSQTILVGYPPFVKDVIDEAQASGIAVRKLRVRILSAAEAYSEVFRDYLAEQAGVADPRLDFLNIYGTADIGAMAWETPTSIFARREAVRHRPALRALFGDARMLPTLAQYNPQFMHFESPGGTILVTGNSVLPLIRYSPGDNGRVFSMDELRKMFSSAGIDFDRSAHRAGLKKYFYELPFVAVYERNDFAIKFRLRDLYPEMFRDVFFQPRFRGWFTGKFEMATRFDQTQNQYLEMNVELKKGRSVRAVRRTLVEELHGRMLRTIRERTNGPGGGSDTFLDGDRIIRFTFWPAEDPRHFRPGVKQKWVERQ